MQLTFYLSASPKVPQFKPTPWYKRILLFVTRKERVRVVIRNGWQCYTHPDNLVEVKKILETYNYKVVLRANLTKVEN